MPELKRNMLNFGYRINFKYEGILAHSFGRFYRVMKFVLPTMKDLNFSPIEFDSTCIYLNVDVDRKHFPTQFISNFKIIVGTLYHLLISIGKKLLLISHST